MVRSIKSSKCSLRAREKIPTDIRRKVARSSHFACSICGSIPIVFHHIEEWSKHRANDEQYLISVCDKCHRGIHGEGGSLFSKTELYERKRKPKKPPVLRDNLPLGAKKNYSFFIGSNFISEGEKASLIRFPTGYTLTNIDTSAGILKLSVLAEVRSTNTKYLIKDNELMISTKDIWDMHYSRNSLTVWKIINNKKYLFIKLVLLPDIVIISRMHTIFNGKLFRIFKLRSPQKRQLTKIEHKVKCYEKLYNSESKKIDKLPKLHGTYKDIDFDSLIKQTQKDKIKNQLEKDLMYEFCKNFNWDWLYYQEVLSEVLEKSSVFQKSSRFRVELPPQVKGLQERVRSIREKYSKQFEALKNVVVEYDGMMFHQNIMI